jgi:hypothetical protein
MKRDQKIEFDQYVSFMEWVCDQEVSDDNTNEVKEDSEKPSITGTSIVPTNTLKAANNINYTKIGA